MFSDTLSSDFNHQPDRKMTVKITVSRVLLGVGCFWCCVNSPPSSDSSSAVAGPGIFTMVSVLQCGYSTAAPAEQQQDSPQQHPEGTESKQSTVGAVQCPVLASAGWW